MSVLQPLMDQAPPPNVFRIATYNVEWFFEKVPTQLPNLKLVPYREKALRLAEVIASLPLCHIIAVQEVQNETVLEKLVERLLGLHNLSYKYYLGKYTSGRTGQKVGFLVLNDPNLVVHEWDSFQWEKQVEDIRDYVKDYLFPLATEDLLTKNIWMSCSYCGKQYFLLNFHMKASNGLSDIAIRDKEAIVIEGIVQWLRAKYSGSKAVVLGDYNDTDQAFKSYLPPPCLSLALERIRNFPDVVVPCDGLYNCLVKVPKEERRSTIYDVLIDHICVDIPEEEILDCKIYKQDHPKDNRVSDHWPVVVTFVAPVLAPAKI